MRYVDLAAIHDADNDDDDEDDDDNLNFSQIHK